MGGNGPGDHPGVVIVHLTGDIAIDTLAIEAALASEHKFLFIDNEHSNAVFASEY